MEIGAKGSTRRWTFALALPVLSACLGCSPRDGGSDLNKDLRGEWRNVYLQVTMSTIGNSDSTKVTECDSTNWEQMLGIRPIRTFFLADGTYRSEYYNLRDSLVRLASGSWQVSHDSLIMRQMKPDQTTYKLKTQVRGGVATFDGMIDFDGDGVEDDHYVGKQRRQ